MANLPLLLGQEVTVPQKQIIEPFNAPESLIDKLRVFFPESIYSLSPQSLLYRVMSSILGDGGLGEAKKSLFYPRLNNALQGTHFNDLNRLFGNPLNLPRLRSEIYDFDPEFEILTQDEWAEVKRKDAWYRARCLDYMRAIQLGNTPAGMELLCRAATGLEAEVFERWRYLDDQISDESLNIPNIGRTDSPNEVILRPIVDTLSVADQRRIIKAIERLKPANILMTTGSIEPDRQTIAIDEIASSSNFFQVKRLITGNFSIDYPPVNTKQGLWIETGVEKEAPKLAFGEHSEVVTYPSIANVTASSFHVGPFNQLQRLLFSHLATIPDTLYQFNGNEAFTSAPINLEITSPWVNRNGYALVNEYFPIGYFADPNAPIPDFSKLFWASREREAPESEELVVDFGVARSVNILEFECSTKPYSIDLQYWNGSSWIDVTFDENVENKREIFYIASIYPWETIQHNFETINTNKLKLIFTRREGSFPYEDSPSFEWSIEVRHLRAAHAVVNISDFIGTPDIDNPDVLVGDQGTDVLGNAYRTTLDTTQYTATRAIDGALNTYWQSQANPSRFAVESLYLDITSYPNLVPNAGGEEGTTGWQTFGTNSRTSTTELARSGTKSIKVTYSNDTRFTGFSGVLEPNTSYTASVWIYIPDDWNGGPIVISDHGTYVGATNKTSINPNMNLRNQWQQIIFNFTTASDVSGAVFMNFSGTTPTIGRAIYFDDARISLSEEANGIATVFDEIYTDPITSGCLMHIYYSDEEDAGSWDNKLWTPISRHYILQKGFHKLPAPIKARFIKLEFTKLVPVPYELPRGAELPTVRYSTHPTWVSEYIKNLTADQNNASLFGFTSNNSVELDYENLGLRLPVTTKLSPELPKSIESFIQENTQYTSLADYQIWKSKANFTGLTRYQVSVYPNNLYQSSLIDTLKFDTFINRYLFNQEDTYGIFNPETPLVPKTLVNIASKNDRILVQEELTYPDTWFPRRCRHGYKIIEAERSSKVAYIVGVREVSVHNTPLDSSRDNEFYLESLANEGYIENNTFTVFDWRYIVPNTLLGSTQANSINSELGNEHFNTFTT